MPLNICNFLDKYHSKFPLLLDNGEEATDLSYNVFLSKDFVGKYMNYLAKEATIFHLDTMLKHSSDAAYASCVYDLLCKKI